jgi:hypothetical protein
MQGNINTIFWEVRVIILTHSRGVGRDRRGPYYSNGRAVGIKYQQGDRVGVAPLQ